MPAISRASIISGPARITYDGQQFWSKGDVTLKVINDRFDIQTAHAGKVDERFIGRRLEVQFEPSGRWDAAATALFPYRSMSIGQSAFGGGTDKPLTINGRDGRQIVVHAAAVTTMPQIRLAVNQTLLGPVTFTGIVANNVDPTNAAAYYTESGVTYPGDSGFDVADILTKHCTAEWGVSSPWDSFLTEAGWTIDFALQLSPQNVDGIGLVDMTFQQLGVTAKCIPVGPTAVQILSKVSPATAMGATIGGGDDLVISGADPGDPLVTISAAAMVASGLAYGNTAKRVSETEWIATYVAGQQLFEVDAVPTPP